MAKLTMNGMINHPLIEFTPDGKSIGKLINNGGILHFEGNTTESAKQFFDEIVRLNNTKMKELEQKIERLEKDNAVC
jgi:short-subunit dehydrogenase